MLFNLNVVFKKMMVVTKTTKMKNNQSSTYWIFIKKAARKVKYTSYLKFKRIIKSSIRAWL